ncbi:MAG: hypothetical protein ACR2MQ_04320 [Gemmatimonadaceae bacterium]
MLRRLSAAAVAAVLLAISIAACSSTTAIIANLPVTADTLVAYALSGTPASLPSGLAVTLRSTVRVDATASFDVAFDFDPHGNIIISPARTIVSPLTGNVPLVGLQTSTASFDAITTAPGGYYRPDTAIVVKPGEAFIVLATRSTGSQTCLYSPSPHIYAKVVIDSVKPSTTRAIYLRQTVDPNCGYKSLEIGLPTK